MIYSVKNQKEFCTASRYVAWKYVKDVEMPKKQCTGACLSGKFFLFL